MFCIWSRAKFNRIDVLKLFCLLLHFLESINSLLVVHGPLARKMSQVSLWTFQSVFFSLCRCCLFVCFFSFLKQERHFEFLSYGGSWHRATLGSVNLFKIIRGISQVWENAQTKKLEKCNLYKISYNITISWLYPLNDFRMIFFIALGLRDSTIQELFCWDQLIH